MAAAVISKVGEKLIYCVQGTRWSGSSARYLGGDCKILHTGSAHDERDGVGLIDKELQDMIRHMEAEALDPEMKKGRGSSIKIDVPSNPNNVRKGEGDQSLVRIVFLGETLIKQNQSFNNTNRGEGVNAMLELIFR
ncbi:hypothetical protein GQR58_014217 [Nymphon striatum]|nr:hypothetical protein GQR58_014217 [Nymphon striatum]